MGSCLQDCEYYKWFASCKVLTKCIFCVKMGYMQNSGHRLILSAHKFSWNGSSGSTFASDLMLKPGQTPTEFTLRNERRNTKVEFKHCKTNRDREGDILSWSFKSLCGKITSTIFND